MNINIDYINARRLLLPAYKSIHLVLVGCGGTGSWLAPHVARAAIILREKFGLSTRVSLFDPDVVETKNIFRQNFCQAEIGRNKALALAYRYGPAWGLAIDAYPDAFSQARYLKVHEDGSGLVLLLGCVDNTASRREIMNKAQELSHYHCSAWWLDCGNHRSAGQVLLGSGGEPPKDIFPILGLCAWLPSPALLHPDLVADEPMLSLDTPPAVADTAACLSCADLAMIDEQSLGINVRIAAEAADYLNRLLLFKDLRRYATYIDMPSGSTLSRYITPENIEGLSCKLQ